MRGGWQAKVEQEIRAQVAKEKEEARLLKTTERKEKMEVGSCLPWGCRCPCRVSACTCACVFSEDAHTLCAHMHRRRERG